MKNNTVSPSWRTPPATIPDSEIAVEYSADVIVVGLGHAGTPAVRAAAEAGASVIAIEKMKREKYSVLGQDFGHINSDFLASRGVPKVDPIELFNEWIRRSGNRANPKLVMQFCQKSGEAFNWYMEPFTQEQMDSIRIEYWPLGKHFSGEISGQKFWAGTAWFSGITYKGNFSLLDVLVGNQERAREHGAELHFGMDAQQLVMNGNRVVGVVAKDDKGRYVKYQSNKGVILATGISATIRKCAITCFPILLICLIMRMMISDLKGVTAEAFKWALGFELQTTAYLTEVLCPEIADII